VYSNGARPYPKLSNLEVADFISEEKRMNKPENCPDNVFEIMTKCWAQLPQGRPTFEVILNEIEDLLKKEAEENEN
jgi:hypothetical protein